MSNIAIYWGNIPEDTLGGIDRVTNLLAKGFTLAGHMVFLIYSGGEERVLPSFYISKYKYIRPERGGINSIENLNYYLKENKINYIINQRAYDFNVVGSLAKAAIDIPIYSCLHNLPGFEFFSPYPFKSFVKKIKLGKAIRSHYRDLYCYSTNIVLLSESFKDIFANLFLRSQEDCSKLTAIANPLSFETFPVNLEEKEKIVLYVGRLEEKQKAVSKLLRMWMTICEEGGNQQWRLVIVGDGPNKQDYMEFVKSNNIKRISFEGRQRPENYYLRASVVALTSNYEGFGLVLTEAMQFGCVPIAFDTFSTLNEIIDNGVNGYIVPKDDEKEYIEVLKSLMSEDNNRKNMAVEAIRKSDAFSLDKIISKWETLFKGPIF